VKIQPFHRNPIAVNFTTAATPLATALCRWFVFLLMTTGAGCGSSNLIPFTDTVRMSYTGNELSETKCYVSADMEFVSLRKGEVEGDDLFKREVKKTLRIDQEMPGQVIRSGSDWVLVQFADSINITFVRNPSTGTYQTPGWGTINVGDERFDINMKALAGKNINLLVGRTREP
jgi:hypothetical protein